jgi:tetratricopeptide (TPR) repeat protein
MRESIEYYLRAIEKDQNYALAYAGLAQAYFFMGNRGFWTTEESGHKQEVAALKALELDGALAEGHAQLGVNKFNNFDWAGAERELKRALELDPDSESANRAYFQYLSAVGRADEALTYARWVLELDPTSTPGTFALCLLPSAPV